MERGTLEEEEIHHDEVQRRERYNAMPKDITVKELVENDTSSNFVPDLHSSAPVLSQNQNIIGCPAGHSQPTRGVYAPLDGPESTSALVLKHCRVEKCNPESLHPPGSTKLTFET